MVAPAALGPQPLTPGHRPWCTRCHPPSWSERRGVTVSLGVPWFLCLGAGGLRGSTLLGCQVQTFFLAQDSSQNAWASCDGGQ